MALDGADLFAVEGVAVVELDISTGATVRTISGPAYDFTSPSGLFIVDNDLVVQNRYSITEVAVSTGALIRVLGSPEGGSSGAYQWYSTAAIATYGPDMFVASEDTGANDNGSLTEVDVATGAVVRVIGSAEYDFAAPAALAVDRGDLFVASPAAGGIDGPDGNVTEINAATGALVRVLSGAQYRFVGPDGFAVAGPDLFVANGSVPQGSTTGDPITEVDASTGALVRLVSPWPANDVLPTNSMVVAGGYLLVEGFDDRANQCSAVAEVGLASGVLVKVLSGAQFASPGCSIVVQRNDILVADQSAVARVSFTSGDVLQSIGGSQYGFDGPTAIVADGPDLFVANADGNSLTELDAQTGALVRVLAGPQYHLSDPGALAVDGADLFVTGPGGVTELNAGTGALVRVLSGSPYDFDGPDALAIVGNDLFVGDSNGSGANDFDVVEVNASTGAFVRTLPPWRGPAPGPQAENLLGAVAFAVQGADLFISNFDGQEEEPDDDGGSVAEFNTSTQALSTWTVREDDFPALGVASGHLFAAAIGASAMSNDDLVFDLGTSRGAAVKPLSSASYEWDQPDAFGASGPDMFVANGGGSGSVTELDGATGALVSVLEGSRYKFNSPDAIAVDDGHVFVANGAGASVTEFPAV
jgi:hypothetical protein